VKLIEIDHRCRDSELSFSSIMIDLRRYLCFYAQNKRSTSQGLQDRFTFSSQFGNVLLSRLPCSDTLVKRDCLVDRMLQCKMLQAAFQKDCSATSCTQLHRDIANNIFATSQIDNVSSNVAPATSSQLNRCDVPVTLPATSRDIADSQHCSQPCSIGVVCL
jgi:hypothetical protein